MNEGGKRIFSEQKAPIRDRFQQRKPIPAIVVAAARKRFLPDGIGQVEHQRHVLIVDQDFVSRRCVPPKPVNHAMASRRRSPVGSVFQRRAALIGFCTSARSWVTSLATNFPPAAAWIRSNCRGADPPLRFLLLFLFECRCRSCNAVLLLARSATPREFDLRRIVIAGVHQYFVRIDQA